MFLKDLWYLALPSAALAPGTMQRKILLGEPVLLARGHDGVPFALLDVCPHRAVPLSAGRLENGSTGPSIECPYHGWRFAGDGRCVAIPALMPDQAGDFGKIKVRRFPVVERQGLLWIFMATPGMPEPMELPPAPLVPGIPLEGTPNIRTVLPLPGSADHAVLGLIDPAHGPFVHNIWFWRTKTRLKDKTKRYGPSPLGFTMLSHPPSANSFAYKMLGGDLTTEISFALPGLRIEHVRGGDHHLCNVTAITPLTETTSEIVNLIYWTMPWLTILKPFLLPFVRQFLSQDQAIMAAQGENLAYAGAPLFVQDPDAPSRWYFRLKKEWIDARAEGRPFVNPVQETTLRWRT